LLPLLQLQPVCDAAPLPQQKVKPAGPLKWAGKQLTRLGVPVLTAGTIAFGSGFVFGRRRGVSPQQKPKAAALPWGCDPKFLLHRRLIEMNMPANWRETPKGSPTFVTGSVDSEVARLVKGWDITIPSDRQNWE
jgi:hypothetical protein